MIKAIQTGLKKAKTHWQISALVYALNFVFALGFAMAFKNVLADEFAFRDVSRRLLEGFDFTFLSDMNYASGSVTSLFKTLNWLVAGYILTSAFLSGGIIASLRREEFSLPDFFADSARYVGRFVALSAFFALTVLAPIVVVAIFSAIGNAMSESAISEAPVMIWTVVGIGLGAITLAFFYLAFEVAKFEVACENKKPFRAYMSAFKITLKNIASFFGIMLAFLLCVGVIGSVLHLLAPKGETGAGVFALALMQQALVASRVFFRVATMGALLEKYREVRPKQELAETPSEPVSETTEPIQEPEPTKQAPENAGDAEIKSEQETK